MSEAATSVYPATCPKCGTSPVTLVTVGDPNAAKEETTEGGVTVTTHLQFLSCERCKHSWNLPPAASA